MVDMVKEVKDYYQILGVEPTATTEEIKRRFRELVRRYHPDVHPDKLFSHEVFRQILEAYKVLGDPEKRRIYDSLRKEKKVSKESLVEVPTKPPVDIEGLLLRAEISLIRGNFRDAIELCNEVLRKDPRNAFAYNLLGDIFRAQGKIKEAIEMYSYAVQFDPHKLIYAEKLDRLLKGEKKVEAVEEKIKRKAFSPFLFSIGLLSLIPISWWISHNPGTAIKNFPFANFSLNLIIALSLSGLSLGFFSGCSRFLRRHDEELIFALSWVGKGYLPLGLILGLFALGSFWGSLVIYAIISAIQEHTSATVWKAYLLSFMGSLVIALSLLPVWKSILLWGGNFSLPFFFIGWLIGDIFRPIGS